MEKTLRKIPVFGENPRKCATFHILYSSITLLLYSLHLLLSRLLGQFDENDG
jgi:hypothetical protein